MNCSCRTAALRIFVRSVVRVHNPSSVPTRGTRSCWTLSQPRRDDAPQRIRTQLVPTSVRRRMSTAASPLDGSHSDDELSSDTSPPVTDVSEDGNDATTPRFPKALKAKKKQKRLPKPRESSSTRTTKSPPGTDKIPKNRRKREARAAAAREDGKTEGSGAQVRTEHHNDKREALAAAARGDGKTEDSGSHMRPKQYSAKRESREAKPTKAQETKDAGNAEPEPPPKKENWQSQKAALKEKFPEGWSPRKRLSPDALAGIKALHQQFPEEYTTEVLANKFEVSAEAIRRILKSKWEPAPEEEVERQERWFNRGKRIWSAWAEEGKKPPTKWRKEGVTRDPSYHEQRRARSIAHRRLAKTLM